MLRTHDTEHSAQLNRMQDFRYQGAMWVTLSGLVLLAPFTLQNLMHDRYVLGFGSLGLASLAASSSSLANCVCV